MDRIIQECPYKTLIDCGALYESPKDQDGRYKGPLVPYAAKDSLGKNYVGWVYYNMAMVEQKFWTRKFFAELLAEKILENIPRTNRLVAAPMGGIILSVTIADMLGCQVSFFEKKVMKPAGSDTKEESVLVYGRHSLERNEGVIIFDDLCNNFSTTSAMVELLTSMGAEIRAIACIVNRSTKTNFKGIPIISALHMPTDEYLQNDPKVKKFVDRGEIVWNPKQNWERLMEAMERG